VLLRRLLVLVVLLLVLLAVANAIAPRESTRSTSPPPAPVTTPSPQVAEPIPPAGPGTVELSLSAARAGARNVVRAHVGDLVHLVVSASVPGSVQLSGYDLIEPVDAASPAEFDFVAEQAGTFTVRLLDSGAVVGRLRVKPTA
jgi:hypothetical protein